MTDEPTGRGIASLVMSILALTGICPCIGSVLGVYLGAEDSSSVARAGVILGWIGLAFWGLVALAGGVLVLLAGNH